MDETAAVGTTGDFGEPAEVGTIEPGGEPQQEDVSEGQPETGPEPSEEFGPEHKSYKEIQSAFSKKSEEAKALQDRISKLESQFQPLGGVEQALQSMMQLAYDPDFQKWAGSRGQEADPKLEMYNQFGIDPETDPDTARTLDAVSQIADMRAKAQLQSMQQEVQNMKTELAREKVTGYLSQLRQTEGFEHLDDLRETMASMSEFMAPEKRSNPSMEDIKDLYWMAASRSGKIDEYAQTAYKRQLEKKKTLSQEKPSSSTKGSPVAEVNSIMDAFNLAKQQMGK